MHERNHRMKPNIPLKMTTNEHDAIKGCQNIESSHNVFRHGPRNDFKHSPEVASNDIRNYHWGSVSRRFFE